MYYIINLYLSNGCENQELIKSFQTFLVEKMEMQNEDSRRCDIRNFDIHRASSAKHWKNKEHLVMETIFPTIFLMNPLDSTYTSKKCMILII